MNPDLLMKKLSCFSGVLTLLMAVMIPINLQSQAALPDQETYNFVRHKYNLLLQISRGGCSYYANPQTLSVQGNTRVISVLLTRGDVGGGSACNGIFEFLRLTVRCQSQEISYSDAIGSPANMGEEWQQNLEVANRICSL